MLKDHSGGKYVVQHVACALVLRTHWYHTHIVCCDGQPLEATHGMSAFVGTKQIIYSGREHCSLPCSSAGSHACPYLASCLQLCSSALEWAARASGSVHVYARVVFMQYWSATAVE